MSANHPKRHQPKLTAENTDGYNASQLAELNRRFDAALAAADPTDRAEKSFCDNLTERVQAAFDNE